MDEYPLPSFPELPDEAVAALSWCLDEFYERFHEHYFAQLHRYYHDRPQPDEYEDQSPALGDPPF